MANEVNGYIKVKDKDGNVQTILPVTKQDNVKGLSEALAASSSAVSALAGTVDKKVDKVSGKGLSSNDYTTAEKTKLSGIAENANNYSLPAASGTVLGGVKTGSNITNSSGTISLTKANVTAALGYTPPTSDTTYGVATTSANGLMSATDKTKLDGITATAFGTCATAAETAKKVVTLVPGSEWSLKPGSIIVVQFTNTNTAVNPTLNVNNTGDKPVSYGGAVISDSNVTYAGYAGRTYTYIYDGINYVYICKNVDNNTTYSNASLGQGYGTCTTAASTIAKAVTLSSYTLATGGIVSVKFTYDVPASATMNINSKGAKNIYYRGSAIKAGVIKAGDTATFIYSSQYHLISIDRDDDSTYTTATASVTGLMSSADKSKLDGVASGATKTVVDTVLSASSGNPVSNSTVNAALGTKVDKVSGKGLSSNDFTTAEKTKLSGIAEGANKTVVDDTLNTSSSNAISNKAVSESIALASAELNKKANITDVNAALASLEEETDVLSARMDEFTKLPEGSTTGDAELADGRIGADGKTYTNIGSSIRGQVTDLKEDLTTFTGNKSYVYVKDKSINRESPTVQQSENGWESALISCKEGDTFIVSGFGGNSTRLWMFADSNGNLLTESKATIRPTAYEIAKAPVNSAYLSVNSKYTSEEGKCLKHLVIDANDIGEQNGYISEITVDEEYPSSGSLITNVTLFKDRKYLVTCNRAFGAITVYPTGFSNEAWNLSVGQSKIISPSVTSKMTIYCQGGAGTNIKVSVRDYDSIQALADVFSMQPVDYIHTGYIRPDGNISTETGLWSGLIPVKKGSVIKGKARGVNRNLCIYAFYDANQNFISGYTGTNDYEIIENTIPSLAAYVAFSKMPTHSDTYFTLAWDASVYANALAKLGNEFFVGYGNADNILKFDKVVDAFWAASKIDGTKTIHIASGTYDLLEEIGGIDYIQTKENKGLNWKDNVQPIMSNTTIIGHGKVILNFLLPERTVTDSPHLFSAINICGDSRIENIEIHSCRCRYGIHDESGSSGAYRNANIVYKNVKVYHNENGEEQGNQQAIGCGYAEGQHVTLENCYLLSKGETWSCHALDGVVLNFKNCIFKTLHNSFKSIRISQNGTRKVDAYIDNCIIDNGLYIRNEWDDARIEGKTDVTIMNSNVNSVWNGYTINHGAVKKYDTISGTETILVSPT